MTALVTAFLSGWLTLRVLGFRFGWPWRVVDLLSPDRRTSRVVSADGSGPLTKGSHSRRHQREVTAALPAAADLLKVAVSAGHSLHGAIAVAAEFGDGPVCAAMGRAHHRFEHGASLLDELSALPEHLGPAARSFSATLVMAMSSGAPVAPALQRLADAERRRARRQLEERVRRLPVLLLAPLVTLVLPAFIILTIVPVVLVTADIDLAGPTSPPIPRTQAGLPSGESR